MGLDHPTLQDIRAAADRIRPFVHRTPLMTCRTLDRMCNASLFFKCENLQKVGAFKIRGATNAVFALSDEEAARGVATHSSGNHAAAVAQAARWRGVAAHVVMPENAPEVKRRAVAGYGANITLCKPTLAAREETLAEVVRRTGAVVVHPYNDLQVIAGQSTVALELLEDEPGLDIIVAPVGGGGLLSGTALAVSAVAPATRVIGAEPQGADDAYRSLQAGRIIPQTDARTIADGLLTSLGDLTFAIIQRLVFSVVTVEEEAIVEAMRLVWERMKIVVEPSAAVPLGAVLTKRNEFPGKRIGVVLSGGNVDVERLPWIQGKG